ncbi:MAG: protein kinase [Archangium sp.]
MAGELIEGTKVAGRYVVVRLLGRGGMGAVYEARHEELGKLVALKVLLPKFAEDTELVARFFREARAAAAIHHPGIVDIYDLGRDGSLAFIAMELLKGEELTTRIRFGSPLGPAFVAAVGLEIAEALSAAHERGVIHRDIKPQNIFLAEHGRDREVVKILDFGIAKLTEGEPLDAQLTRTGQVFGTPLYMAPEQAHARKDLDARIDVYAIGAVLYEALAGAPPFEADSYPSLMLKIVGEPPRPLLSLRPELPPALVELVGRAMAKDRDHRFSTTRELADALASLLQTLPPDPPSEPRRPDAGPVGDLAATAPRATPLPESATPNPRRSLAPLVTPRSFPPVSSPAALQPPPATTPAPTPAPTTPPAPNRTGLMVVATLVLVAVVAVGAKVMSNSSVSTGAVDAATVVPLIAAIPDAGVAEIPAAVDAGREVVAAPAPIDAGARRVQPVKKTPDKPGEEKQPELLPR